MPVTRDGRKAQAPIAKPKRREDDELVLAIERTVSMEVHKTPTGMVAGASVDDAARPGKKGFDARPAEIERRRRQRGQRVAQTRNETKDEESGVQQRTEQRKQLKPAFTSESWAACE